MGAVTPRRPGTTPVMTDLLLAAGVAGALAVVVSANQADSGPTDTRAYAWAVGLGALMLVRRQLPVLVLVLTGLGFFSYYAAGFPAIGVAVPIAAAVFSAAESGHLRAATVTAAAVVVASTAYRVLDGQDAAYVVGYELVSHVALLGSVILLGHSLATRRELVRRRAELARLVAAQVATDADLRAREERMALARELHDSIGHSLTVASLYASVAKEAHTDEGDRLAGALDQTKAAVSQAMGQLRSTVALLRTAGTTQPPHQLLPSLDEVLAAPRRAGYDVDATVDGEGLPPEVATAAVRVVQEAVTNTLKHSNASAIRVRIARDTSAERLEVEVRDNGSSAHVADSPPGHGIAGMRERVESLGGRLHVSGGSHGWRVCSTIPLKAASG